jgi:hypothetical protein
MPDMGVLHDPEDFTPDEGFSSNTLATLRET